MLVHKQVYGRKNFKIESVNWNILVRATPPVVNIAKTSRTRKIKKSHLFFCTTIRKKLDETIPAWK